MKALRVSIAILQLVFSHSHSKFCCLIEKTKDNLPSPVKADEDMQQSLCLSDPVEFVFPLPDEVAKLIEPVGLPQRLVEALNSSEILWKSLFSRQVGVFTFSTEIVVKAVCNMEEYTEYTALQYLDRHKPDIPVLKLLGLMCMNTISLLFMSHMGSVLLGEVWHTLDSFPKSCMYWNY